MAEIKYKISGKSDTTAIAKTQLAMKKLGSEVVNLNKMVSGFAIAKVMQVVSKVTNGATENFLAQNKALQQYNATVAKFGKSLSNLNKIQNEVSRNNFFDGDSINNATKMAVAMGLTEKQIEDVLKASTDLAASGIMPLDQAVKSLSFSYSGNVEELKRLNPELANLTKEQLKQGEAVKIIGKQYEGMADAMANTFEGRDTQWKNSFSDLQAEVGEIIQKVKYFEQGEWLDPINRLSNWLNDNSGKIASFIVTLPENFKIAAIAIKDIVKELFSIDFWAKNGEVIVEIFKETFIAAKDVSTAIVVALMKSLLELVKITATNMGKSLVSGLFGNLGSFGIEALYRANVIDYDTRANLLNKLDDKVNSFDNAIENWQKENKVTLEEELNNVKNSWKDVGKTISDSVKETQKTVSGLSQEIDSSIGDIVSKATKDINDNVTENISNVEPSETTTDPTTYDTDSSGSGSDGNDGNDGNGDDGDKKYLGKIFEAFSTIGNTFIKSTGEIGNYVTAAIQGASNGGAYGAILAVISQLLSDIMKVVSENSEKFQVFQNFVTLVLESLISEIVPIFDEFVTPFLESFSSVKEILSGVVYLLGGIIGIFTEIFKEFTRELNIIAPIVSDIFKSIGVFFQMIKRFIQFLQPVMNALSYVTRIIATAIYSVEWAIVNGINLIIRALNQIPWVNISEISGFEDYGKGVDEIWNGGGNTAEDNAYLNAAISQSASNITGSSASYTAARDIYVTISYDHSYVNGDAREIALNLYNELKDCKKLNLIA